jgi:tRNA-binding protein
MSEIGWQDFQKVEMRVGTNLSAAAFPEAIKPAYKLTIDFGKDIGVKKSSARITDLYRLDDLVGKQVIGVVNFPAKKIGPFMSECLVSGFVQADDSVVLAVPDKPANNGSRLA